MSYRSAFSGMLLGLSCLAAAVRAEEPAEFTLAEVERFAIKHHPALTEAAAQTQVLRGKSDQAGAYPNPVIYASSPQWAGNISQFNTYVGQDFITGGKLKLDQAAATRAADQADWAHSQAEHEVRTAVRQAFFSVLVAQRRYAVFAELQVVDDRSRDISRKLLEAGEGGLADVLSLEAEAEIGRAKLENAELQLLAAQSKLASVTGSLDWEVPKLVGNLNAKLPNYQDQAVQAGVISENALSQISRLEIDRTRVLLDRAIVQPVPNFNLQAGYQRSLDPSTSPGLRDQGYAQFSVTVPLWDRNRGNIQAAQSDLARASAQLRRVEAELAQKVVLALTDYRTSSRLVERYQTQIIPRTRQVLKLNQQLFEKGQTDFDRVFTAQRTLADVELSYLDAQEKRWHAAATVAGLLRQEQFP